MATEFEMDAYRKDRELYVILRGRLVLNYCTDAKTRLSNLLASPIEYFYLSMAELNFLDSAGLGVMVGLKMNANKNRTHLVLLSPPQRIQDIFRVSKLDTIFEIRSGAEADLVAASMKQEQYCLWRDSKDVQQGQYNTVADFGTSAAGVQLTMFDGSANDAKVRQLLEDGGELFKQGENEKAIDCYRRALVLAPDNLSALNNLGIVLEKLPEWYPQAVDIWKRVLALSEQGNDEKHANRARKHIEILAKLMNAAGA